MISSDMLMALRARWKTILAVLFATIAVATAWLFTTESIYIARASLLFDEKGPSPALQDTGPSQDGRSLVGTQADIIRSSAVARRVIQTEKLLADPALQKQWRELEHSKGSFETWLTNDLLAHLDVVPERDTNVLGVQFRSTDPTVAARMANSFAANFVATRMQISTDTAKQYARWFEQRTTEVRGNLERAQKKLTNFQRGHGMVDGNSFALEADRLSSLSTQLATAESGAADLRARAGTRVSQSPDVQSSAVVEMLRQQIASSQAKVAELSITHGDNHPELIAARAQLASLRAKLGSETSAASQSVRIASSAASSREAQLQNLVNAQRGRMLTLAGHQSELEALQNEVNTAQKAYDAVTQRLNLMRLQSGLPTTNAQQVDRATPPLLPASPNAPLMLFVAALAGLVLGVIAAMLLEWRRPLVRTAGGLLDSTNIPVIGNFDIGSRSKLALAAGGI